MLTTPLERYLYSTLKSHVMAIAAGEESCTEFEFNIKDYFNPAFFTIYESYDEMKAAFDSYKPAISIAAQKACEALRQDCPYELYWSRSGAVSYGDVLITFDYDWSDSGRYPTDVACLIRLEVNINYQTSTGDERYDYYHTDTTLTQAPTKTVENAKRVVSQYASLPDYEKLIAYKDWICESVSYDYYSNGGTNYQPWQIIYVFDNNPDTNVVCSGYTKAFQYLCDLSVFKDPTTKCYSVGGSAGGWHTWNIITLTNSKGTANYLADITHTDSDDSKQNAGYFLNGASGGSIQEGYYFDDKGYYGKKRYEYAKETLNLFGTNASSILNLSLEDYLEQPDPPEPVEPSRPDNNPKPDYKPSKPSNNNKPTTKIGWVQSGNTWYYYNSNGTMLKGWQLIDGVWYYLGSNGAMATGWTNVGGTWYYLNGSGAMQTGWQNIDGTWYYLNPSGAMATGWQKVGGTWYYLRSSGAMATGWQQIGGAWYYLNGSGAMQTGWYKVGSKWYYSNASGAMQTNRWIGNYYVGSSGAMATSQWVGNYYVNANGLWVK